MEISSLRGPFKNHNKVGITARELVFFSVDPTCPKRRRVCSKNKCDMNVTPTASAKSEGVILHVKHFLIDDDAKQT